MLIDYNYMLLKASVLPLIFGIFEIKVASLLSFLLITFYQDVLGLILKVTPLPLMDVCTFFGTQKNPSNIMSVLLYTPLSPGDFKNKLKQMIDLHPKMRSEIVKVLGDYYYKPLTSKSTDEIADIIFTELKGEKELKNDSQIDEFISKAISIPIPLNQP